MIRRTVKKWIANAVREYMSEDEDMAEAIAMELSTSCDFDELIAQQFDVSDIADNIDAEDIAVCFDVDDIANSMDISAHDIAQEMDTSDITDELKNNLDYYEIASGVSMDELAREIDVDDLVNNIGYSDISDAIDMDELSEKVYDMLETSVIADHFDVGDIVDAIMVRELDAIKSELMAKVDALVNAIELAMVIHTEE